MIMKRQVEFKNVIVCKEKLSPFLDCAVDGCAGEEAQEVSEGAGGLGQVLNGKTASF